MITVNDREEFLMEVEAALFGMPTCVEIGVYKGEFSKMIWDILEPSMLYLIDPFETNESKKYPDGLPTAYSTEDDYRIVHSLFKDEIESGEVHIIMDYSNNTHRYFPKNFFDFVYIDGSHNYGDVNYDLQTFAYRLSHESLMCGHDYGNDLFPGVKQAVDEFCKEHGFEMIIFNENGGDYALRAIQ